MFNIDNCPLWTIIKGVKETTKNILDEMVIGYVYGKNTDNINFPMLFNTFIQNEKFPVEKFNDACTEFFDYVIDMKDKFIFQTYSDKKTFLSDLHRFCVNFSRYFHIANLSVQEQFTNIVNEVAEKQDVILDVGSGELPVSSLLFGQSRGLVESMDKEFLLSSDCLGEYNVDANLEYFDITTNIDSYDFITGNRPCSAIKPIIMKCTAENKPFIVQACDCDIPGIYANWKDYSESFKELDGPIYFYGDYIYNVDSSNAIKNLIDRNSIRKIQIPGIKMRSRFNFAAYRDIAKKFLVENIPKPTGIAIEEIQNELE